MASVAVLAVLVLLYDLLPLYNIEFPGIFDYEISDEDVNIRIMNYQGKADVNGSTVLKTLMAILKG